MSKRKRHTELYDYMRILMASEVNVYCDFTWGRRREDLIKKLLKKGWIKREIVVVSRLWAGNSKTNTRYRTTKKGRRAIYKLDRVALPEMRGHIFTLPQWSAYSTAMMLSQGQWEKRKLKKFSQEIQSLKKLKTGRA